MPSTPADLAKKLRDQGHTEAAFEVLLDAAESAPKRDTATGQYQPAAPPAPPVSASPGPVEGVDYLSHAQMQQLTADQMTELRAKQPDAYALSMKMLSTSTRGRAYRA